MTFQLALSNAPQNRMVLPGLGLYSPGRQDQGPTQKFHDWPENLHHLLSDVTLVTEVTTIVIRYGLGIYPMPVSEAHVRLFLRPLMEGPRDVVRTGLDQPHIVHAGPDQVPEDIEASEVKDFGLWLGPNRIKIGLGLCGQDTHLVALAWCKWS